MKPRIIYQTPPKTVMDRLNSPALTLLTVAAVVALAWYSQNREHGYSPEAVARMDAIIAASMPMTDAEKIVYLFGGDE